MVENLLFGGPSASRLTGMTPVPHLCDLRDRKVVPVPNT